MYASDPLYDEDPLGPDTRGPSQQQPATRGPSQQQQYKMDPPGLDQQQQQQDQIDPDALVMSKLQSNTGVDVDRLTPEQIAQLNDAIVQVRQYSWQQYPKETRAQMTKLAMNLRTAIARRVNAEAGRATVVKKAYVGHRTKVDENVIGTEANVAEYGKRAGVATAQQLMNRARDGYTGMGQYNSIPQRAQSVPRSAPGKRMPQGRCEHEQDGFRGEGAYWGNRLGQMVPWGLGKYAAPLLSKAEDWAIKKGIEAAQGYVGSGDYASAQQEAQHEGTMPSRGDYLQGPGNYVGMGDYNEEALMQARNMSLSTQPIVVQAGNGVMRTNQIVDPGKPFSRRPPQIESNGKGGLIFRHREYIKDIKPGSSLALDGFQSQLTLNLNPGLKDTFPLASQFAKFYQEYRFKQLFVRYRSVVSPGNNNASGTVMIATIYNPNALPFTSKRSMDNSEYTVSGTVADTLVSGVEEDPEQKALGGFLYVRTGPVAGNLSTYDQGITQIATAGAFPDLTIGELWIDYVLELDKLRDLGADTLDIGDGWSVAMTGAGPNFPVEFSAISPLGSYVAQTVQSFPLVGWLDNPNALNNQGQIGQYAYITETGRVDLPANHMTSNIKNMKYTPSTSPPQAGKYSYIEFDIESSPAAEYTFTMDTCVELRGPTLRPFDLSADSFGYIVYNCSGGGTWRNSPGRLHISQLYPGVSLLANVSGSATAGTTNILTAPSIGGTLHVTISIENDTSFTHWGNIMDVAGGAGFTNRSHSIAFKRTK